jgi:hypothetical protein
MVEEAHNDEGIGAIFKGINWKEFADMTLSNMDAIDCLFPKDLNFKVGEMSDEDGLIQPKAAKMSWGLLDQVEGEIDSWGVNENLKKYILENGLEQEAKGNNLELEAQVYSPEMCTNSALIFVRFGNSKAKDGIIMLLRDQRYVICSQAALYCPEVTYPWGETTVPIASIPYRVGMKLGNGRSGRLPSTAQEVFYVLKWYFDKACAKKRARWFPPNFTNVPDYSKAPRRSSRNSRK